jgi:hypothetical protein
MAEWDSDQDEPKPYSRPASEAPAPSNQPTFTYGKDEWIVLVEI